MCRPVIAVDGAFTVIEPWSFVREVPYLIHSEFELPLMLEGRKPMAFFCEVYPNDWLEPYLAPFDPFVLAGRIVSRTIEVPFADGEGPGLGFEGLRNVYFTLPGEEWRIDAHMFLRDAASKTGWNDSLERLEGSLLGYEDWQNDWWIEHRPRR